MKSVVSNLSIKNVYSTLKELNNQAETDDRKFVGIDEENKLVFSNSLTDARFSGKCVKLAEVLETYVNFVMYQDTCNRIWKPLNPSNSGGDSNVTGVQVLSRKLTIRNATIVNEYKNIACRNEGGNITGREVESIDRKVFNGTSIKKCLDISKNGCSTVDLKKITSNFIRVMGRLFPEECKIRLVKDLVRMQCPDHIRNLSYEALKEKCGGVIDVYKRMGSLKDKVDSSCLYVDMDCDGNLRFFNYGKINIKDGAVNLNCYVCVIISDFDKEMDAAGFDCENLLSDLYSVFRYESKERKIDAGNVYTTKRLLAEMDCLKSVIKNIVPEKLLPLLTEVDKSSYGESSLKPEQDQGSSQLFSKKQEVGKKRSVSTEEENGSSKVTKARRMRVELDEHRRKADTMKIDEQEA